MKTGMPNQPPMCQPDVVVYGIKQMILDHDLRPGEKLPIERDLAPRLGVSRSSLREGVRALSIMGVVETRQGAGMYVTSLDSSLLAVPMGFAADLQEQGGALSLYAVRRLLETEAAALAAAAITDDELASAAAILDAAETAITTDDPVHEHAIHYDIRFHQMIAAASGNPVLAALVDALASRPARGRPCRSIINEGADGMTLGEHRAILSALASHSSDAARLRMGIHLVAVEECLLGAAGQA